MDYAESWSDVKGEGKDGSGMASVRRLDKDGVSVLSPTIQPQFNVTNPNSCSYKHPSSSHTGALLVGLSDGSVRTINSGISTTTFNIAMVPNDSLPLPFDW